jgi:hypothetical protein
VIHGVVLGSPLPRGAYLDVTSHDAQVRSLLVLGAASVLWRVIRQQSADMGVCPKRLTGEHWQRPAALVKSHESRATDHIVESRFSSVGIKHRLKNRFSSVFSNGAFR